MTISDPEALIEKIFLACDYSVRNAVSIGRRSSRDKEYHVQDWFKHRLEGERINFDEPSRNSYPDFRIVNSPLGFELKGTSKNSDSSGTQPLRLIASTGPA
jgi:hypothetical protein